MKQNIFILALALLLGLESFAYQLNYSENIQKAHLKILEYQFDEANSILEKESADNLYVSYLFCYEDFLKSYFKSNLSNYENFNANIEKTVEKLETINSDESNILIADLYLYQGFIHFLWDEKFAYAKSIFKGNRFINNVSDNCLEKKKIKSLYEVLGYGIPDKYKRFASWFGFSGDAMAGLKMLDDFLASPKISDAQRIEGQVFHMYLCNFLDIPLQQQNFNFKSQLLLYVYLQTVPLSAKEKVNLIEQFAKKDLGYFDYLKGKILLQMQDVKGYDLLEKYVQNQEGNTFKHDALYQMYAYNIANNNPQKAQKCKEEIILLPQARFPIDKKALKRCNTDRPPFLVKAGQLFDAGMFKQSLSVLYKEKNNSALNTTKAKVEFVYRKARNYQMLNQEDKAIKAFEAVIKTGLDELYFVPFSSYQCGKIYIHQKQYDKAKQYLNKTFELNNGDYKHSINLKTKFALDKISN